MTMEQRHELTIILLKKKVAESTTPAELVATYREISEGIREALKETNSPSVRTV